MGIDGLDERTVLDLLEFTERSPSPYHAVAEGCRRLDAAGFVRLRMDESWDDAGKGRFYVVQGDSSLAAWIAPGPKPNEFRIVGAHTDSPNLRLKPKPDLRREGYRQLAVEVYGGALLNSWLDRDLGVAGQVMVRGDDGRVQARPLRIDRPWLRIPQLAIHLDREVNEKGLVLQRHNHLLPIWGLESSGGSESLRDLVAEELTVQADAILASDLMLYDLTKPALGGVHREFVFSARLDNLAMCHAALTALIRSAQEGAYPSSIPLVVLFDHEEVGSESSRGAGSSFLSHLLERIFAAQGLERESFLRALARSTCISADMAHAVHPNYADRHDANHRPALNGGPVLKVNSQQRYATSAETAAFFTNLCREREIPLQVYSHRADLPCGSTIGPIVSTGLGIPTIDVGNPMLSMHSAREMGGAKDPAWMVLAMTEFFKVERW